MQIPFLVFKTSEENKFWGCIKKLISKKKDFKKDFRKFFKIQFLVFEISEENKLLGL